MSLERTGSIESESSWGDDYDGGIVNPAGSGDPSQDPGDEITVERTEETIETVTDNGHQGMSVISHNICWCCMKMGYKIRKLWGTCQTEEAKGNKDIIIRLMLRELIVYVIFLTLLCFVAFGMTSSATYYFTNAISATFLDVPIDPVNPSLTFKHMTNSQQWYQFALGPLLSGLYSRPKFDFNFSNGDLNLDLRNLHDKKGVSLKYPNNDNNYTRPELLLENQLYGLPRLRLLKVRNDSCAVHRDFQIYVTYCYGPYSRENEDRKKFGPTNSSAWFYQSAEQLESSSIRYPGKVSTYGGGGFVQDLNTTYYWSRILIEELKKFDWLVAGATRAVFIDFTLYNSNVNLFCIVRLMSEFPSSGGLITSWNFRTVKLLRYSTTMDYVVLACESILIIFLIYFIIEETIEIYKHGSKYLKSFFNLNDLVIVLLLFLCIALNIHRTVEVSKIFNPGNDKINNIDFTKETDTIDNNNTIDNVGTVNSDTGSQTVFRNKHVDLDNMGQLQTTFDTAIAVLLFFAWLKLFKFIGFNRTLSQLSLTMGACLGDILAFSFIFVLVYLSFAQLGYFLFGSTLHDFNSLEGTFYVQFRILLGDYKLDDLVLANRVLGPIYFILLVFVLFFILANMFLAIINDAYSDVKIDLSRRKSDLELLDYIKRGYQKLLDKLNWRRENKNIEIVEGAANKKRSHRENGSGDGDPTNGNNRMKSSKNRRNYVKRKSYDNDSFDDSDEDSSAYGERVIRPEGRGLPRSLGRSRNEGRTKGNRGVSHEEFSLLQRRVDRMEHSIGSVVSKIDAILVKLEGLERLKTRRKDAVTRLLDSVTESEGAPEEYRQARDEVEVWDSYSGVSVVDPSPASSNNSGRVSHNREHPSTNAASEAADFSYNNVVV